MHYVYKLLDNITDEVIYVGETIQPDIRFRQHTRYDYPTRRAKFANIDCRIEIVETFQNRQDALEFEGQLKKQYGLEWVERANRTWIRKMTYEDAQEMRRLYSTGKYTYNDLIQLFPVNSTNSVWRIINNKTYNS